MTESTEPLGRGKIPAQMKDEPIENAHPPSGQDAEARRDNLAEERPGSGYVSTEVAAAALRVSPRTIRGYIRAGELEAISEGEGVQKRWLVSIDSVHALRDQRQASGHTPQGRRVAAASDVLAEVDAVNAADLVAKVQELQYRLGRAEARVELQALAESTIREERDRLLSQLEEERGRAEAERERAEQLRGELEQARRSWWRRFFGLR
jgi:hypothetical protein